MAKKITIFRMRFLDRDYPYMYYVSSKNNWVDGFKTWQFFLTFSTVYMFNILVGFESEKLQKMWFCDVLYGWSQFIVHSAKYIQGFTYVAYGRGRVAEDNKGWTIMIIDQGPNVWASIGQRPLGYNVFARMSVALKKKTEKIN